MKRRLPPLSALRAFEAAARRMSFRRAGDELCVTPSAISHQVKALEAMLGRALFVRNGSGLTLTRRGREYLRELTPLLDGLDASTRRVSRSRDRTLRVLSTPGFAARWLVPRLHRFEAHERIEIAVSHGAPSTDFTINEADVVIHWGAEPVAGVSIEPMMQSGRYPVASPVLVEREGLRSPRDLLRVTLLRDDVLDQWAVWFACAGLDCPALPDGPRLAHCELSLTAAEHHQGVSLAYDAMARGTVADGRLMRLFDIETPPLTIYSFACSEGKSRCPDISAFRDWLFAEVAAEGILDRGIERAQPAPAAPALTPSDPAARSPVPQARA